MEKILAQLSSLWGELRRGNVSGVLARYGDLLLPVGLMLAIGTLFIPLPPAVISLLIVVNLAVSVIVLATSLYITTPTQLTSYPTILLLTTVFGLTLSVWATRAILTLGTAGGVIEALGQITAQGSIIVGAVMFVTILVVQFIVVAKGAARAHGPPEGVAALRRDGRRDEVRQGRRHRHHRHRDGEHRGGPGDRRAR